MPALSRRDLLRSGTVAALSLGLSRSLPTATAQPLGPRPRPGDAVEGPLAAVYGRYGQPRGLTLSPTSDRVETERTVTWLTSGADAVPSFVEYGPVPSGARPERFRRGAHLTRRAGGSSLLAPMGHFDEDTATATPIEGEVPVRVHRATMTGLPPGQAVCYRVGSREGWSEVHTFQPAPSREEGFRFTHLGDHGTNVASRRCTAAVLDRRPDLHLIAGDISYANGWQPTWDRWAQEVEPLTCVVPLVTAPGNHEAKDFYGETYRARFSLPNGGRNWSSFDHHNVHLVSWTAGALLAGQDPRTAIDLVADELVGLERDLARAALRRAAGEIDFIAVVQHFPLYTNHRTRGPFSPYHVLAEEQILQRYRVDLVLVGHDNMYQRSHPMAYGAPRSDTSLGYVQVAAGGGGASLYEMTPADFGELGTDPAHPLMQWGSWLAAWAREYSFVEYEVRGTTITGRAFGWADVAGQNDIPQDPATYDEQLVPVPANEVDPTLAPRQIDEFTVRRKPEAVIRAAALPARPPVEVLAGVPEARGILVPNLAEDCTRHHH